MKKLIIPFIIFLSFSLSVSSQSLKHIDYISPFNDGLSAIQKNNKWAFVDADGEMVIDFRDDLVLSEFAEKDYPVFNSGRCLIMEKKEGISYFGYIDKTGKTILKPQYLNATEFHNGLAIILELYKNILGQNDVLDKQMIDYSYSELIINPNGEILHYVSEKPTHITLSKDFVNGPPAIKSKLLSAKLMAVKMEDNTWSIKKIELQ